MLTCWGPDGIAIVDPKLLAWFCNRWWIKDQPAGTFIALNSNQYFSEISWSCIQVRLRPVHILLQRPDSKPGTNSQRFLIMINAGCIRLIAECILCHGFFKKNLTMFHRIAFGWLRASPRPPRPAQAGRYPLPELPLKQSVCTWIQMRFKLLYRKCFFSIRIIVMICYSYTGIHGSKSFLYRTLLMYDCSIILLFSRCDHDAAIQLTLYDYNIFHRIRPVEFLNHIAKGQSHGNTVTMQYHHLYIHRCIHSRHVA